MDKKNTEEKLKKVLTGVTVIGGLVLLGILLVYAPNGKGISVPGVDLSMPVSDTKKEETVQKEEGIKKELKGVQFFTEEGRTHVSKDTRVTYKTNPHFGIPL
jgi:hypothetical protein